MSFDSLQASLRFAFGGSEVPVAEKMFRTLLLCCAMCVAAQLLIMWCTRWGSGHRIQKAGVYSLVVHLCLFLSWATYVPDGTPRGAVSVDAFSIPVVTFFDEHASHAAEISSIEFQQGPEVEQVLLSSLSDGSDESTASEIPTTAQAIESDRKIESSTQEAEKPELAPPLEVADDERFAGRERLSTDREQMTLVDRPGSSGLVSTKSFVDPITKLAGNVGAAKRSAADPPLNIVRGVVRDAETGHPLAETTIRFDRPDGAPILATTDAIGQYELHLATTPEHFAVSASHPAYLPAVGSLDNLHAETQSHRLDFSLGKPTGTAIPIEAEPKVHHLGNDRFCGAANSQFQRRTEGLETVFYFVLSAEQTSGHLSSAALIMLARGIEFAPEIRINGREVPVRGKLSPKDGSYAALELPCPANGLREGNNMLRVCAAEHDGDIDDFEFVNVQIGLSDRRTGGMR